MRGIANRIGGASLLVIFCLAAIKKETLEWILGILLVLCLLVIRNRQAEITQRCDILIGVVMLLVTLWIAGILLRG